MTESRGARYPSTGTNSRQRYTCVDPAHREHWQVIDRRCNYSAFNGYRYAPSAYSAVLCPGCGRIWRTKAAYVDDLPDAPEDWYAEKRPDAGKVEPPTNAFCQRCGYSSGHVRGCQGEMQADR